MHPALLPLTTECGVQDSYPCSHADVVFYEQLTLGEEGFFAQGSPYTRYNPFGTPGNVLPGWSERIGQVSGVSQCSIDAAVTNSAGTSSVAVLLVLPLGISHDAQRDPREAADNPNDIYNMPAHGSFFCANAVFYAGLCATELQPQHRLCCHPPVAGQLEHNRCATRLLTHLIRLLAMSTTFHQYH